MPHEDGAFDYAKFNALSAQLDRQAREVADMSGANHLERETIMRLSRLVRHGHKFADLTVRKDGLEYTFEADWICRLFTSSSPLGERAKAIDDA